MRKDLPLGQGHCHRRHRSDRGFDGLQPYPSRHVEHDLLDGTEGSWNREHEKGESMFCTVDVIPSSCALLLGRI